MRQYRFICILIALLSINISDAKELFRLDMYHRKVTSIPVNQTFEKSEIISPFKLNYPISGFSINANIEKISDDYFVRIILIDKLGREYLVLESYNLISNNIKNPLLSYCEETNYLDNIIPDIVKIVVKNARLTLNNIEYINSEDDKKSDDKRDGKDLRFKQVQRLTDIINSYNSKHNKLWRAGITELSLKKYESRKRILGINDDICTGGFEYYCDGIFEIGKKEQTSEPRTSFIDEFDWRNRHGKNWITPNKDQMDSGFCSAFTAIGVTEAMARLYYNQLIDVDLSEQEAACCNGTSNPWTGMSVSAPLQYIRDNGVCNELDYPFVNDSLESLYCRSSSINPTELIKIGGFTSVNITEDGIKNAIINHGPLASSIHTYYYNPDSTIFPIHHAMPIVGFGKLHVGDTIYRHTLPDGSFSGAFTVKPGDPRVGCTYFIYKNSYGTSNDEARQGYMYIIHYNCLASVGQTYYLTPSIESMIYEDSNIICEDADGDGFYFWGLGPKPSHCPAWAPDTPDGDDSNINYGPMDSYGNLQALPYGITIKTPTTYTSNFTTSNRIGIVDGGRLTVTGTTTLTGDGRIRVCEGGILEINGGTLQNADLELVPGCQIIIKNNGKINMANGKSFDAPAGALVDIPYGSVN